MHINEGLEAPATPWDAAGGETGAVVVCCSGWSWVEWDATSAALYKTFSSLRLLASTALSPPASSGGTWDRAASATLSPSVLSIYITLHYKLFKVA